MIPALKNFYEQQHAKDLTALKRLYDGHTCIALCKERSLVAQFV